MGNRIGVGDSGRESGRVGKIWRIAVDGNRIKNSV